MWCQLASEQSIPVLDKVLRTKAVCALLVVIFRFSGKHGLAAMKPLTLSCCSFWRVSFRTRSLGLPTQSAAQLLAP